MTCLFWNPCVPLLSFTLLKQRHKPVLPNHSNLSIYKATHEDTYAPGQKQLDFTTSEKPLCFQLDLLTPCDFPPTVAAWLPPRFSQHLLRGKTQWVLMPSIGCTKEWPPTVLHSCVRTLPHAPHSASIIALGSSWETLHSSHPSAGSLSC